MAEPGPAVEPAAGPAPLSAQTLLALVVGQIGVHATMAGLRMAAPLQALHEGASTGQVGLVLALFAVAPVLLALHAGRMADRHGFHRPMAVAVAFAWIGTGLAVASTWLTGWLHVVLLAVAALAVGGAANFGVLASQRTAGLLARDATERVRLFSWLGVAPSLANVLGPVSVGLVIDLGGFRAAYGMLCLLPLVTIVAVRWVPPSPAAPTIESTAAGQSIWTLLHLPGMRRLLAVNWLLSICWDVHGFAVPILGHGLGFSASTIGFVLGTFTLSVSLIRLAIPTMAHRMTPAGVLTLCMLGTAVIFTAYPFAHAPWMMGTLAAMLGVTLGAAQPMLMSALHHLTPDGRHGESLAFRSITINLSSVLMPLAFGAMGVVVGAGALFWIVGATVGAGALLARRVASW